jgi:solute carrier family 13 (sodium-dependent dicarboxylate transporter), member 2/3/5
MSPTPPPTAEATSLAARLGLAAGPVAALTVFFLLPSGESGLPHGARACGGVATLMAIWWMTEALPLEATALLPLVLLPITGVYAAGSPVGNPFGRAAAPFADPAIFLFLGGFMIALAIEKWGLHRRMALLTVLAVGTSPALLIGGFMLATALVSMWISNTATTVMMLPIGLSVVTLLQSRLTNLPSSDSRPPESQLPLPDSRSAKEGVPYSADYRPPTPAPHASDAANFATCLLLGIAYAASLGGFATLVGTPPNVFFKGYMVSRNLPIDFFRWMLFATPLAAVYLVLAWLLMTRLLFPIRMPSIPGGRELIVDEYRKLGPVSRGEWTVLIVFLCTAALWISGSYLKAWPGLMALVPAVKSLDDPLAAMLGAIALFLIPVNLARGQFALDWKTAIKLPWGVLLLFGGGLSLAAAITDSGLATWIGQQVSALKALPTYWQITLIVALIVFTGELTNNLAAVVALLPILFEVARGLEVDPRLLCVPAVIAASCGFMLPVATPPNAIAFATGHIRLGQMIRAGFLLDLLAVGLIPACVYLLGCLLEIKL